MAVIGGLILGALLFGLELEKRRSDIAVNAMNWVLNLLLWLFIPFIAFVNIVHVDFNLDRAGGIGLGYVTTVILGVVAWLVAKHIFRLSRPATGAVIVTSILANTGYFGLPVVAALLGDSQLGEAAAFDVLVSAPTLLIGAFAIGAAMGTNAGDTWQLRLRAFATRNPPLIAVVIALLAPSSWAPNTLVDLSHIVIYALAPMGFFVVGVTLEREAEDGVLSFPPPLSKPIFFVVALRTVVAPLLLLLISLPLISIPDSYLLLVAMPCGINSLVVAHTYGLDVKLAASAIAWSTPFVVLWASLYSQVLS